jgi:hypothetical protein
MAGKGEEKGSVAGALVVGGMATGFGVVLATLLAAKPAEAATPEEKLNYLIDVLTILVPVLAQVAEGQTTLIQQLQQWLAAQGVPPGEGIEVTVTAPWVAKAPEQIFSQAIRAAGIFYSDKMVNWTRGKRLVIKVESSLDQACQIQLIGNIADTRELATDVGPMLPCAANGNVSAGLAFDNWHPYIGVGITTALAPTAGILTITAVIQE